MIYGSMFNGDEDDHTYGLQFATMYPAIEIIVRTSDRLGMFARHLVQDTKYSHWGYVSKYDLDSFVIGHEIFAAVWRYQNNFQQIALPFMQSDDEGHKIQQKWIDWLKNEVQTSSPETIRFLLEILNNQNNPVGLRAELDFADHLLETYSNQCEISWNTGLASRFQYEIKKKMSAIVTA